MLQQSIAVEAIVPSSLTGQDWGLEVTIWVVVLALSFAAACFTQGDALITAGARRILRLLLLGTGGGRLPLADSHPVWLCALLQCSLAWD